jgi:hypothetical protein
VTHYLVSRDLCLITHSGLLNDYSFLSSSSLLYNINGQSILLVEGTPSKYETYRFTEGMQGACLPLFLHSAHVEAAQERGLKANLKTEAMIELLLDSSPLVYLRPFFNSFSLKQPTFPSPSVAPSHRINTGRSQTILNPVALALNKFYDRTL